jgi:hypothetical protein
MIVLLIRYFFKPKRAAALVLLIFAGLFVSFVMIKMVMPENYAEVIRARSKVTDRLYGSENAETTMLDIIRNNGNPLILLANVIFAVVRLMIPIELLAIGFEVRYVIYMVYQFIITGYYVRMLTGVAKNRVSDTQKAAVYIFSGFLLGSALFEPGWGSWIRHESAALPLMFVMFFEHRNNGATFQNVPRAT